MNNLKNREIVLASASPRRHELLKLLGIDFKVEISNADENINICNCYDYACKLAKIKSEAVAKVCSNNTIIIGADTIVVKNDIIFGKPFDIGDARNMISQLQNASHSVITGICIIDNLNNRYYQRYCKTIVNVQAINNDQIDNYLSKNEYQDKAGAYGIQGAFAKYITSIDGCYYNVMGLPINMLFNMLNAI